MNAEQIVGALRRCPSCRQCVYGDTPLGCQSKMRNDAADLIESLQAQLEQANKRIETRETLLRLQETTMSILSNDKDTLVHQLSASQRREDAAVEILKKIAEYNGSLTCHCNDILKIVNEWRGPQQTGEGERDE